MKHARNMVLVPEDRLNKFIGDNLSDMDKTLRRKDLSGNEKATIYLKILQKYVHYPFPADVKPKEEEKEATIIKPIAETEVNVKPNTNSLECLILHNVPEKFKRTAEDILNFVRNHSSTVSWNAKGELIYREDTIHNTNIAELVVNLLENSKNHPKGQDIFHRALTELSIPTYFIKNKYLLPK
ncbi:hypothetical protein X975_19175, partial [Stegodyphus mimosarum]